MSRDNIPYIGRSDVDRQGKVPFGEGVEQGFLLNEEIQWRFDQMSGSMQNNRKLYNVLAPDKRRLTRGLRQDET